MECMENNDHYSMQPREGLNSFILQHSTPFGVAGRVRYSLPWVLPMAIYIKPCGFRRKQIAERLNLISHVCNAWGIMKTEHNNHECG